MALDHDGASLGAQTASWIGVGFAGIGPIGDLETVNPNGDVWAIRKNGLVKPLDIQSPTAIS